MPLWKYFRWFRSPPPPKKQPTPTHENRALALGLQAWNHDDALLVEDNFDHLKGLSSVPSVLWGWMFWVRKKKEKRFCDCWCGHFVCFFHTIKTMTCCALMQYIDTRYFPKIIWNLWSCNFSLVAQFYSEDMWRLYSPDFQLWDHFFLKGDWGCSNIFSFSYSRHLQADVDDA